MYAYRAQKGTRTNGERKSRQRNQNDHPFSLSIRQAQTCREAQSVRALARICSVNCPHLDSDNNDDPPERPRRPKSLTSRHEPWHFVFTISLSKCPMFLTISIFTWTRVIMLKLHVEDATMSVSDMAVSVVISRATQTPRPLIRGSPSRRIKRNSFKLPSETHQPPRLGPQTLA